jgi:hypothetical protein
MQAAMVGTFMIVDSFGHYLTQTVHDHGAPAAPHKYPVALCRSMHKHAQRASPSIRQIWMSPISRIRDGPAGTEPVDPNPEANTPDRY